MVLTVPDTRGRYHLMPLSVVVDADNQPLDGANRYGIRFEKGQTPPVNAFGVDHHHKRIEVAKHGGEFDRVQLVQLHRGGPSVRTPVGSAGISQCAHRTRMTLPVT